MPKENPDVPCIYVNRVTGEACDKPSYAKGLCKPHYHRQLRGGDMDKPMRQAEGTGAQIPGTRVSKEAAKRVSVAAKREGMTTYKVLAWIIEEWAAQDARQEEVTGRGIPMARLEPGS